MAREAAGQRGLAVRHWRNFLATDRELTPAEQAELRVRVKDVTAENPTLEVSLEPSSALGPATKLTLLPPSELIAAGLPPIDLRDPIAGDVGVAAAHFKTSLDPGTWTLSITGLRGVADQTLIIEIPPGASRTIRPIPLAARRVTFSVRTAPPLWLHPGADLVVTQGGAPSQRLHLRGRSASITAAEGPVELGVTADGYRPIRLPLELNLKSPSPHLTLRLKLDPRSHLRTRLGLGLGLGLPGLALFATGSLPAASAAGDIRDNPKFDRADFERRNGMAFLAGVGGGLILGSLMAATRPRSTRWWLTGISVGGAMALAGPITILGISGQHPTGWNPSRNETDRFANQQVATNVITGLGTSLLAGGLAGLITHLVQLRPSRHATNTQRGLP